MKTFAGFLVLAGAVGCATAPKAVQLTRTTHNYTLSNGISVVHVEDHRLPTVAFTLRFAHGTDAETSETLGASSFLTDLMTRGAGTRDAMALAGAADKLGAHLGASVSRETLSVSINGLAEDASAMLALLADVARRPTLAQAEYERLVREYSAAYQSRRSRPKTLANHAIMRLLYGTDRMGRPGDGDPASLKQLTQAKIRQVLADTVQPSHLTIGVFGDLDPAAVRALLEPAFGTWKGDAKPYIPDFPVVTDGPTVHIVDKPDLTQVQVILAHAGIPRAHPQYEAAQLLNYSLGGGGFSSRLMKLIRSKEGLTYGIRSGFAGGERGGPFTVSSFTRVGEVRKLIDLTRKVIQEVAQKGVTEAELKHAKGYLLGSFPMRLETPEGEGGLLLRAKRLGLGDDFIAAYPKRLAAITLDQVNAVAQLLLHPDRLKIVLVGPKAKLFDQVDDLGSVSASRWQDDAPVPPETLLR
jgi:zinc protease